MKVLLRAVLVLSVFVVAFLITTIVFDTIERHNGYYDQGLRESSEVMK